MLASHAIDAGEHEELCRDALQIAEIKRDARDVDERREIDAAVALLRQRLKFA